MYYSKQANLKTGFSIKFMVMTNGMDPHCSVLWALTIRLHEQPCTPGVHSVPEGLT